MMNSKHVPKRRFSGFGEEWKEIKLYEVVQDFIVPMRDKPKEFSGNIPWTRIDDIEGKYISRSLKGHCVSLETVKSMNLKIIPEDSLIVSASATFGTVAIVKNDLITNQTFIGLVPKNKYEVEFLFYLFQSPKVRNYMKEESAGSTIFYISRESFEKMEIDLPDEKERKLLIKQLCTIDSLITIHQHKLDKLKNLKKAYLSEMFPAEGERVTKRRFPGFEGEWEIKKLKELTEYRRGSFPQPYGKSEWYGGNGSMPFVQVVDVLSNLKLAETTKQQISKLAQNHSVFVPQGTVVITLQGSIGRVAITQYDSYVDRTLLIFEKFLFPTDIYYWALSIQQKFDIESKKAPGGTIKTITKEALSEFEIFLPTLDEQKQIGSFFQQLDKSISLQQQKLDKLNDLKKAYLNELFV